MSRMKTCCTALFVFFFFSCGHEEPGKKLRDEVTEAAARYAEGQLKNPVRKMENSYIIVSGAGNKRYIINPSDIFTGLIDSDDMPDAVITLFTFEGDYQGISEHLIMISNEKGVSLLSSVESDMKILRLSDRIITAEIPTHPRTSPLYHCNECREIVRYRLENGNLVKAD